MHIYKPATAKNKGLLTIHDWSFTFAAVAVFVMELSLFAMGYANCTLTHPNGNIDEDSVRKRGFQPVDFMGSQILRQRP